MDYHSTYFTWDQEYEAGKWYARRRGPGRTPAKRREPIYKRTADAGYAAVRALNPSTGEKVWDYKMRDMSERGHADDAARPLFSGSREGYFFALDAEREALWKRYLGGAVMASPVTYMVDGRQFISVACGQSLFTFSLGNAGWEP